MPHEMMRLAPWIFVLMCCLPGTRASAQTAEAAPVAPAVSEDAEQGSQDAARGVEREHGTDRHLGQLLERYLWIVPSGSGNRASTGAALLVLLTLLLQLSAKTADLEMRSFGRCLCVTGVLGAATAVELGCTPLRPLHLAGIAVLNLGLWLLTTRLALNARMFSAIVTLASFLLALLSGVLLLEIAGFLMGGHATA
jgi:hypothetical protein